ncbi:Serine/threonine-protein phosphatase BSL2 [Linum perenne]
MDEDSSMASEPDQDTLAHSDSSPADREQVRENPQPLGSSAATAAASSPPPSPTLQQPATPEVQVQQQSPVAGPRPAPTYSVVNAIIEKKEDGSGPRCGHTLTAVAAVGEEGTPGYIGPRLILFGGATGLEGNSGAGTPSSAGGAGIRLSGATADVHCYDVLTNKWSRLTPIGEPPTPRAAHVATAVGTMVVIQGSIFMLLHPTYYSIHAFLLRVELVQLVYQRRIFMFLTLHSNVHGGIGPGPGPRYGHVMALVGQRYLMAIGGNDGKRPLSDVWALDTAAKPYEWRKLEPEGEGPPPCMYATASARSDGLLLLCGGRDANSVPLASAYGLAKHRDGRWEWAIAPGVSPSSRYQHAAVFVNARLHVSGGALGGGRMVEDSSSVAVLDTAAGVWCDTKSVITSPRTGRYSADAAGGDAAVELTRRCRHAAAAVGDLIFIYGGLRGGVLLDDLLVAEDLAAAETTTAASLAAAAASNLPGARMSGRYGFIDDRSRQTMPDASPDGSVVLGNPVAPPVNGDMYTDISTENAMIQGARRTTKGVEYLVEASAAEAEAITATLAAAKARQVNGEVELPDRERTAEATPSGKQLLTMIKPDSVGLNHIPPAGVRLHHRAVVIAAETGGALGGMVRQLSIDQFENEGRRVSYGTPESATAARKLLDRQMSINSVPKKVIAHLLKPRGWKPPVRRQFFLDCNEIADLCDSAERIFSSEPSVLQLKAPIKIFGDLHGQFGDLMRLFDEYGAPSTAGDISYIDYLFLGDYVDRGQHSLETIALLLALKISMPFLASESSALNEWSDPTENDSVEGLRPNARGPGLPDRVMEFCNNNDLQLIVRAHECVMDGFERFAQGHLITLFSATNYCGTANNAGAILVLGRDLVVVPKLIHPLPPAISSPEASPERHIEDTWMQELNANRPPTPTRGRPQAANDKGSLAWI